MSRVDHADGAGLVGALHRVAEKRARHAVDGQSDVREARAAHREFGGEVVGRSHARQHLQRAHRIVQDEATQVLKVGAVQQLLRRDGGFGLPKRIADHLHALGIGAGAADERDEDMNRSARADRDLAPEWRIADDRDGQRLASPLERVESEAAVTSRFRPTIASVRWTGMSDRGSPVAASTTWPVIAPVADCPRAIEAISSAAGSNQSAR